MLTLNVGGLLERGVTDRPIPDGEKIPGTEARPLPADQQNPAKRLVGLTLQGGWKVIQRLERPPGATGGHFSVGYRVQNPSGGEAFLKALSISEALESEDPTHALESLTTAYNFER